MVFSLVIGVALGAQRAVAQLRIDVPRIPGVPKAETLKRDQPKPELPRADESRSADGRPMRSMATH